MKKQLANLGCLLLGIVLGVGGCLLVSFLSGGSGPEVFSPVPAVPS